MNKSNVKIMIVNDKPELRNIIRNYLRAEGYTKLTVSENGLAALKRLQVDPVDLILADFALPELNGLELLKKVRRDRNLEDIPFILISAEGEQKYVAKAAEYRVNAYLVKPFSHKTLADKVNRILDRRINPTEVDIYYQEANQLAQSGDLEEALEKYRLAMESTNDSMASLHYKIGRIHEDMDSEKEAEDDYNEAVNMSGHYVNALDALGNIYLKNDRPEEALRYLRRGSEISPLNAERQRCLGEALLEGGEFEAAEKAFKMSLNIDPSQTHIFNRLGISLRRQSKQEEAKHFFLQALDVEDNDENLLYNLSRVYYDQGDKETAISYLEKALEVNPDFQEAQDLIGQIRAT